ncbi:MAG: peptide chain release factor N(5)-glutamine methyltransferase, partial [Tidjanibacter sp.]|nr:peptide chain release factor N(5)-glutamine methyltransferase [Tidjanibacter sp.]
HEPSLALFVPDHSPIVFYERIADVAREALVEGGALYFEVHETYASEVAECLAERGFEEV